MPSLKALLSVPLGDYLDPRKLWLVKAVGANSMASYARRANVYELATRAEKAGLAGAFVECGVWRGGCAAIMAYVAKAAGRGRKTWLFDSFEGLPEPTSQDGERARVYAGDRTSGAMASIAKCVGPLEDVKALFARLGIAESAYVTVKGWFQDTLPVSRDQIGPIALLRLDGDWYESTKVCLDNLYDLVVPGGFVIIDDYGHWEGCKKAIDEFFAARGVQPTLHPIDDTGRWFTKP